MNSSVLRLLYLHELRMLVRTRRTVVMSIILPAVLMPLMLYAAKYTQDGRKESLNTTTYRYAVTGPLTDTARTLIRSASGDVPNFDAQEVETADAAASLERQDIHFYLKTITGEEADKKFSDKPINVQSPTPQRLKGVPVIRIVYRGNKDVSQNAARLMLRLLSKAQKKDADLMLGAAGFALESDKTFTVESTSTATSAQVTGSGVGRFLTLFLVMLMFTGGSIAATDIIAGEKERGTLETLLTTAAGRIEIATAKQLAISTVAFVITLIQAVNFFVYVRLKVITLAPNFALQLSTLDIVTLLLLYIPLAATIAAVLLMISAHARTYKEAQLYFFPAYVLGMVPALAAIMPGISLRSIIAIVPVANVSVAVREILTGRPDPAMILVTIGVMTLTAIWLMRRSAQMLCREDIIAPGQSDATEFLEGPELFPKRVLRWFAVMWAFIFTAAANIPQLATFRGQLFFNEVLVFLGASLLMIKIYGLNLRETLALRPVKPLVWLAIMFAIPSGSMTTVALSRVLDNVIPVSQKVAEQMSQMVLPHDIAHWQLYLYVALLPAVCEEIVFRGLLMHGLRKRFRRGVLPIVVGVIFGMFHFALFRIAPTAFLGGIITVVALLTGSIFPGMLLHAGNNAFGVWSDSNGFNPGLLEWWQYIAPMAVFALSIYIVYRSRTPYPEWGLPPMSPKDGTPAAVPAHLL
jgi:sodium transport system permease protein